MLFITYNAAHWSKVRFNLHALFYEEDKADQRPASVQARQDLPPIGAAKQVATPTAHAHTNRSWLWVPFWG